MLFLCILKDVEKINLEQIAALYALQVSRDAVAFFFVHCQLDVYVLQATKEKHVKKVLHITWVFYVQKVLRIILNNVIILDSLAEILLENIPFLCHTPTPVLLP